MNDEEMKKILEKYVDAELSLIKPEDYEQSETPGSEEYNKKIQKLFSVEKYFGRHITLGYVVKKAAVVALVLLSLYTANEVSARMFNFEPWKYFISMFPQKDAGHNSSVGHDNGNNNMIIRDDMQQITGTDKIDKKKHNNVVTGSSVSDASLDETDEKGNVTSNRLVKTTYEDVDYYYRRCAKKKNSIEIVKIKNAKADIFIPAQLDGRKVYRVALVDEKKKIAALAQLKKSLTFDESETVVLIEKNGKYIPQVKSITIESGVKEIGAHCFRIFADEISLPETIKTIGTSAFSDNDMLKRIELKNPDMTIERNAFRGCRALAEVVFPQGNFTGKIKDDAFRQCHLKKLQLPVFEDKDNIGKYIFADNKKLKKVTFDEDAKSVEIGYEWFHGCTKAEIVIGAKVEEFSSEVNTNAGIIHLLGKNTEITADGISVDDDEDSKKYYFMTYKKFIVPEDAKALSVLKNMYYGNVNDVNEEDFYDISEEEEPASEKLQKVEIEIRY